jgi:2-keto-4-pentenoate hydratase/2-oxohepta-3-ene-1,7-dioic acid hydratase in catechol pathway
MPLSPIPSKVICVGKNYLDHAREMGGAPPAEPLFFLKPPSSLLAHGDEILIPPGVGRVDYEGEIAFRIGRRARHVREEEALDYIDAVLPLNDVTARDLQRQDSQWTRGKGFDTFCAVGTPVTFDRDRLQDLRVETRLNGELRQEGGVSDMIFSIPFLISYISRVMTLEVGDILTTGTPAGVGPIVPWDEIEVSIPGVGEVRNPVRAASGIPWSFAIGGK